MNDPNWLYSTIAQSSAAIVAIIGGFITASLLTLTGEKRSLEKQKTDKEIRLRTIRKEDGELYDSYQTIQVNDFLNSRVYAEYNLFEQEMPPLEKLKNDNPDWINKNSIDLKILEREYEDLLNKIDTASRLILSHVDKIEEIRIVGFDDWVRSNKLDDLKDKYGELYEYLEDEYEKINKKKNNKWKEEQNKKIPSILRGIYNTAIPDLLLPHLNRSINNNQGRREQDILKRRNDITIEKLQIETELNNISETLSKLGYPPDLGKGILVLGYLAVFGIITPVIIIANEAFYTWTKWLITASFSLGVIGVFAYMIFLIRSSRIS